MSGDDHRERGRLLKLLCDRRRPVLALRAVADQCEARAAERPDDLTAQVDAAIAAAAVTAMSDPTPDHLARLSIALRAGSITYRAAACLVRIVATPPYDQDD